MFIAPINCHILSSNRHRAKSAPAFGANKIYDVNVKTITPFQNYELTPAEFCEVNNNSLEDARNIYSLGDKWSTTLYGTSLISSFLNCRAETQRQRFFILRSNLENNNEILTTAMLQSINSNENYPDKNKGFEIMYIQAAPFIENRASRKIQFPAIKGAGELTMYSIIKLAKMEEKKFVTLESTNDPFYDSIKMPHKKRSKQFYTSIYTIYDNEFDDFLYHVEQKYNLLGPAQNIVSKRGMSA